MVWTFGALSGSLSAGYGVLFTLVGDFGSAYGLSATQIGFVVGVGFLMGFAAQVLIAPLADAGHARKLVVAGVIVNIVGLVVVAFGAAFVPIAAGRAISGLGIGMAVPALRRIIVLADPDNVGRNVGLLISANVAGFGLGPALSALVVGPLGLAAPFLIVAAICAGLGVLVARTPVVETIGGPRRRLALDLLPNPRVAAAVLMGAGSFMMIGAFDALWDVVHEDLSTPTWMANLGITLFAVPLIVLAPIGGRMAQRIGPYRVGAVGLVAAAAFMFGYGQMATGQAIFFLSMGHALVDGFTIAAPGVAISTSVPDDRQAGAQGLMGAAQALVSGLAAIGVATVYDQSGRAAAYTVAAVAIAGFAIAGFGLSRLVRPTAVASPS